MNIKVSDLKKFKGLSSHIKSNGVLPIHNYIKFGGGKIQKQSSGAFMTFNCPEADEDILVEEKILYDLLFATANPTINIADKKGKTLLSDGKDKISTPVPELSLFIDIIESKTDRIDLSPEFLEAIGSAALLCQTMGIIPDKYMYVMVGNKSVCGISQSYGYYRPVEENVVMVLEKKTALFLSKSSVVAFSETESHYFFYTNEATLGFTKQEMGYGDFAKLLRGDLGDLTFTCSNSDLRSYNSLSISLCEHPLVTMTKKGTLEMYDSLKEISQDRELNSIQPYEDFTYDPVTMNNVLSALYTEELDFYQKETHFFIKDGDKNAVALIGRIKKP